MGVFPLKNSGATAGSCLPHARGGVSAVRSFILSGIRSSPRTWGCFFPSPSERGSQQVFPTHVGVFLISRLTCGIAHRLPHARGGVSLVMVSLIALPKSSPRTWGCFRKGPVQTEPMGLPHARGGVSHEDHAQRPRRGSSPRTWGCFSTSSRVVDALYVFPTHVGVFLK